MISRRFRREREDLPGSYFMVNRESAKVGDDVQFSDDGVRWSGWSRVGHESFLARLVGEQDPLVLRGFSESGRPDTEEGWRSGLTHRVANAADPGFSPGSRGFESHPLCSDGEDPDASIVDEASEIIAAAERDVLRAERERAQEARSLAAIEKFEFGGWGVLSETEQVIVAYERFGFGCSSGVFHNRRSA